MDSALDESDVKSSPATSSQEERQLRSYVDSRLPVLESKSARLRGVREGGAGRLRERGELDVSGNESKLGNVREVN